MTETLITIEVSALGILEGALVWLVVMFAYGFVNELRRHYPPQENP